jgi:MFS family permease
MTGRLRQLPPGVWALGLVSLFMDISSEMIHALLPVFLVAVLGAGATLVGVIEGVGEALALVTRLFSGLLSDRLRRRKPLVLAGYLLGALSKPLFALAGSAAAVLGARSLDRLGKGIRGAPRDALVADLVAPEMRGAAYGLRQSLDSFGAVLGPLLALALMTLTQDDYRAVFWYAFLPGLASVLIIVFLVREPPREQAGVHAPEPWRLRDAARLGRAYWAVLALGVVFTLARFSEAFILLRAEQLGTAPAVVPLMLVILSLTYALGAYPAGHLSDRLGRMRLLLAGMLVLVAADAVLALAATPLSVGLGAALWGLHLALTQGLFAALVVDTCPSHLRGTAFGVFGLASGLAVLCASVLAGLLWDWAGAPATFLGGAAFALLAGLGALALWRMRAAKGAG